MKAPDGIVIVPLGSDGKTARFEVRLDHEVADSLITIVQNLVALPGWMGGLTYH